MSLDQSIRTHWGTVANQTEINIKRHTGRFICVETSFPSLMKLISIAQQHLSHTYPCIHTHRNTSKGPLGICQSKISLLFPPHEFCPPSTQKAFAVLISTNMMEYQISGNAEMLCASPHHLLLVWNLLPCSLIPGSWHLTYCDWQASRPGLLQWDTMMLSGHWRGQWALSAKCVWLSQLANRRQRRWAGTDQAQCLHKHIRQTDRPAVQLAV